MTRPVELFRKPRNRPVSIESTDFDKGTKAIQWRKNSIFQQMVLEQIHTLMQKRKNLNMDVTASTKWTWVNHASKYKMQNYVPLEDNKRKSNWPWTW